MNAQGNTAPEALDVGFMARIDEVVTQWQFRKLTSNLNREGIIDFLGPEAVDAPFDTYMSVLDTIEDAQALVDPANTPGHATLAVRFTGEPERDRFHRLLELTLAGVHGPTMPALRPGAEGNTLNLHSFGYADLSSAGRIATALLAKQYGSALGRNRRLTINHTINEMQTNGVMDYLPPQLVDRVAYLQERFGEAAGHIIMASGHLSLLGTTLRGVLDSDEKTLAVQRPRGCRPAIEEDVSFYTIRSVEGTGAPISGTSIGYTLKGQVYERKEDFLEPYRKRRLAKAGEDLWSMLSGLGITEGIASGARAIGTVAIATAAAWWSKVVDAEEKRHRGLKLIAY